MAEEQSLVPPAKYIFLMAAGLIALMAFGGAVGFAEFADRFIETMDQVVAREYGYLPPEAGPDGRVWVDLAIDMKGSYNATHGVVFWYANITVDLNSSMVDVLGNLSRASLVELRVYSFENSSHWTAITDENVTNYLWEVEYGDLSGFRYVRSINGVAEDPGTNTQWLTYRWKEATGEFEYVLLSVEKFLPTHGDKLVLMCSQLNVYPLDCCSGAGFSYEGYTGPK